MHENEINMRITELSKIFNYMKSYESVMTYKDQQKVVEILIKVLKSMKESK